MKFNNFHLGKLPGMALLIVLTWVLLSNTLVSAAAINDTFHINLQTTYSNGSIQTGTFTFGFNITESSSASCLTPIVYNHSTSLATDTRGIVSLYLPTTGSDGGNLSSLDFDKQYYLCYYRDGTLKDVSQLGRVPYSFRATQVNLSELSIDSNLTLGSFNISSNYGLFTDLNATASIFAQRTKNLSIGYDYVTNGTYYLNSNPSSFFNNVSIFSVNLSIAGYCVYNSTLDKLNCSYTVGGSDTFAANYSNFTAIYGYAINDSLWTLNYSNFTVVYGYAINSTGGSDTFVANYSNFTTIYGYTINDSLWTLNYSTYLTKPTYAQVVN